MARVFRHRSSGGIVLSRSIWAPSTYLIHQRNIRILKSLFLFFRWEKPSSLSPVITGFSGKWVPCKGSFDFEGPIFHFCACWRNKPMEHPIFQLFSFENGGFSIPCWICRGLTCLNLNGFCKGEITGQEASHHLTYPNLKALTWRWKSHGF